MGRFFTDDGYWDGSAWWSWGGDSEKFKSLSLNRASFLVPYAVWTDGIRWVQVSYDAVFSEVGQSRMYISRFSRTETFSSFESVDEIAGDAFITDDARIVLLEDDRVTVLAQDFRIQDHVGFGQIGKILASKNVVPGHEGGPYLMSGPNGGIALVSGISKAAWLHERREFQGSWSSTLVFLDENATEQWHTQPVPWAVRQPPIDGGNDRIYLAGDGLVAIDHGKEAWHLETAERVRATAFSDGGLVITKGATLQLLDRDGHSRISLATPDGEVLVTAPAPASDGSIWVASSRHLYVAR